MEMIFIVRTVEQINDYLFMYTYKSMKYKLAGMK